MVLVVVLPRCRSSLTTLECFHLTSQRPWKFGCNIILILLFWNLPFSYWTLKPEETTINACVYLRESLKPSSLLAVSRASKVTPSSPLPSRSHLLIDSSHYWDPQESGFRHPPFPRTPLVIWPDTLLHISPPTLNFKRYDWSLAVLVHEKQPWLVLRNLFVPHSPDINSNYFYYFYYPQLLKIGNSFHYCHFVLCTYWVKNIDPAPPPIVCKMLCLNNT